MATQCSNLLRSIFFFIVTLFYLHLTITAASDVTVSPETQKIIDKYCGEVLDYDICSVNFRHYDRTMSINGDPDIIVWIAVNQSYSMAQDLASYIANNCSSASTLHDCSCSLKNFIEQLHGVVGDPPNKTEKRNMKPLIKNIKAWLEDRLLDFDLCLEGLEGVNDAAMRTEVEDYLEELRVRTTTAIAFVEKYDEKH